MPVTKTAKRARRSSQKKELVNKVIKTKLDAAMRIARKNKDKKSIKIATSLADRAAKKNLIHKNKASRIKSALSKLTKIKASSKSSVEKKAKPSKKK
jgi:small subunit ribosomal protein S20